MSDAVEIKLRSGETHLVTTGGAIEGLRRLHSYYAGQEKEWFKKTYLTDEIFHEGYEREWMKYREEASVLAFAIMALTGKLPLDSPAEQPPEAKGERPA